MKNNELSKTVVLTKIKKPTQSIVINGVEQKIEQESFVLACPNCGRILFEFPNEMNDLSKVINEITSHTKELLNIATYCSACGTKLNYNFDIFENVLEKDDNSTEKVV